MSYKCHTNDRITWVSGINIFIPYRIYFRNTSLKILNPTINDVFCTYKHKFQCLFSFVKKIGINIFSLAIRQRFELYKKTRKRYCVDFYVFEFNVIYSTESVNDVQNIIECDFAIVDVVSVLHDY